MAGRIHYVAFGVGLFALCVAALIFWLGDRAAGDVRRLVAEGRVAQSEEVDRTYGDKSMTRTLAYVVDGRRYTIAATSSTTGMTPVFDEEPIPVPRLGPENSMQVVYLPSDPAMAYLRHHLKEGLVTIYFACGLFTLIGLFFGAAGLMFRRVKWD